MTYPSISPRLVGHETKQALAEQQAMARADKPQYFDEDSGTDPITAALRQMHDAVASEELPGDFLRLLDEIDTRIAAKKSTH